MGFYDTMIKYAAGLVCAVYRVKLYGRENIPADTEDNQRPGFMLCANHIGNLDPFVIGAAIRVKVYWMAKESLFRVPVVSQIIRAFGAYPVNRSGGDVSAIKRTVEQLRHNRSVGIFPQGHRQAGVDPRTTEIRHGCAMMAFRAGCDILPVAIVTKDRKLRPFRRTNIVVGQRIPFAELHLTQANSEEYKRATEYIFDKICTLQEECK